MDSVVKSAARVLEIFEYLSDRRGPATVTEISLSLGYPQSSTSVLLKCLWNLGYLSQDPITRAYQPTSRVAQLGNWVGASELHRNLLDEIHVATGEAVYLMQALDLHLQLVQSVGSSNGIGAERRLDAHPLLVLHPAGRALLSQGSNSEALVVLRRSNTLLPYPARWLDEDVFIETLDEARRTRLVTMLQNPDVQYATIACALQPALENSRMAIAVIVPVARVETIEARIRAVLDRSLSKRASQRPAYDSADL